MPALVEFRCVPDGQQGAVIASDSVPVLHRDGIYVIRGKKTDLSFTIWGDGSKFHVVTGEVNAN